MSLRQADAGQPHETGHAHERNRVMNHYGLDDSPGPLFTNRAPSVNGSATSAAAADSLDARTLNALQRRVYEHLARRPSTDEETADELEMNPSTVRPRRIELERRGLIVQDGTRRTKSGRMAAIWRTA